MMPAPKKPNTSAATEKRLRKGDATAAARLRGRGWLVFPPQVVKLIPAAVLERLRQLSEGE
jgi:hypothetical protein